MKSFGLLSILCLFLATAAWPVAAQSDYRKGFIINHSNDTTRGYLNYRESQSSYRICHFKAHENAAPVQHTPSTIRAYGFESDKFYQVEEFPNPDSSKSTGFAEVLVQGQVSLLLYEERYYVRKLDGPLQELRVEKREVYVADTRRIQTIKHFQGTMLSLMFDCPSIDKPIQNTILAQKELTKVVELYNNCTGGANVVYKSTKPWTTANGGLLAGFSSPNLRFKTDIPEKRFLKETNFVHNVAISGGIFGNFSSPRISERLSLQLEGMYSKYAFKGYAEYEDNSGFNYNGISRNDLHVNFSQLKTIALLRYSYPRNKTTPYINAGLGNNWHFNGQAKRNEELEFRGVVYTTESEPFRMTQTARSFTGGVGTTYSLSNKSFLMLELRYDRMWNIHQKEGEQIPMDRVTKSSVNSFALLVGLGL